MGPIARLTLILVFLTGLHANADWLAALHRFGYFGDLAFGVVYESNPQHSFDFSIGYYPQDGDRRGQLNLAYRYSHWLWEDTSFRWRPLQAGLFLISSMDSGEYFYRSPDKYPEKNYYDQTALRFGIELGTQFEFQNLNLSAAYYVRFLDNSLIALYNNDYDQLEYFASSGVALFYRF